MSANTTYFKDADLSGIKNTRILIDVGGTLCATGALQCGQGEEAKLEQLIRQGNEVVFLTNLPNPPKLRTNLPIQTLPLTRAKPSLSPVIQEFLGDRGKPAIVIGDSWLRDGVLAARIGATFIPVRSLDKQFFSPVERFAQLYARAKTTQPAMVLSLGGSMALLGSREKSGLFTRLCSELARLGIKIETSLKSNKSTDAICVFDGDAAQLKAALIAKRRGLANRVYVGPHLAAPTEETRALFSNPDIDAVLFPEQWVKTTWIATDQYFNKARVIPLGGYDEGQRDVAAGKLDECVIFAQDAPEALFHSVMRVLWDRKMSIRVLKSDEIRDESYRTTLKKARMFIQIVAKDFNGRALKQAWLTDVPTLSWQPDASEQVPVDEACGLTFSGAETFASTLDTFLSRQFQPRQTAIVRDTIARTANELAATIRQ